MNNKPSVVGWSYRGGRGRGRVEGDLQVAAAAAAAAAAALGYGERVGAAALLGGAPAVQPYSFIEKEQINLAITFQ